MDRKRVADKFKRPVPKLAAPPAPVTTNHTVVVAQQPVQKPVQPKRGVPKTVGHEKLIAHCGHEVIFTLYEEKKDQHRDKRRLNMQSKDCQACRVKKEQDKIDAARKRRQELGRLVRLKTRMPDGTVVCQHYHDGTKTWRGTISIPFPVGTPGILIFSAETNAAFTMLTRLDQLWRVWLRQNGYDTKTYEKLPVVATETVAQPG